MYLSMTYLDTVLLLSKNDNGFLTYGLITLIKSVLGPDINVQTSDDFSAVGIGKADIIVMNSPSLLHYLCHPNFRFRQPHSVVIGLHNKQADIRNQDLPWCFNDMIILHSEENLCSIRTRLAQKLAPARTPFTYSPLNCTVCKCRRLSPCQLKLVKYLRQGYSIPCIARIMRVSVKTVYAHKYRLMEKFGARGDAELNLCIHLLAPDCPPIISPPDIDIRII